MSKKIVEQGIYVAISQKVLGIDCYLDGYANVKHDTESFYKWYWVAELYCNDAKTPNSIYQKLTRNGFDSREAATKDLLENFDMIP